MSTKIGDRVGALLSVKEGKAYLFGYGVLQEESVPAKDSGGMGPLLHEMGARNPTILLDSGETVYGCECWWGPEESLRKKLESLEVVPVDIGVERKNRAMEIPE